MFNIGPEEIILILVLALIFVGPKRLPDMARQVGKGLREFRSLTTNAKRELMDNVSDLNAIPEPGDLDVESLPTWDGTKDGSQTGDVTVPTNGSAQNGNAGTKSGGKSKKKSKQDAEALEASSVAGAAASEVQAPEAPSAASPTVELPAATSNADGAVSASDTGAASSAAVEAADSATTEIPTTDPVEP